MKKATSRTGCRLALAALGLAGAGMGCGESTNPVQATQLSEGGPVSPVLAGGPLNGPLAELEAVRQATARFHDVSAAIAAGYLADNPAEPCVQSPLGVMGFHAPNPVLMGDQGVDVLRPELLLYAPTSGGGRRLVGVEYMLFVLLRNPETGEVGPWISPDPWPSHYQVVTPTPRLFGQTFDGPMPGHTPTMPWHWDLHAWVWAPNPAGMFAPFNPALQCG